ncbi:VOC family protein [Pseudovibrio exalbescens]|uniref:Phenazine biosynthesis protein n=1 Tax=Pseudovibrio exalbescens TaxID=197461 RepID=A0A1U7JC15_9HYPH|nr:VOC family protein [Pseudovibrio exalbescens]OKL42257.1 phenazine biosynthesis protein [Pseudovibrio exalbescens]
MFNPNSVILYVTDVNKSTDFYKKVLEKDPEESFSEFSLFLLEGNFMLGLQAKDGIDPKAQEHFGGVELSLSDVDRETVDRLHSQWSSMGVDIALPPQELAFGYTFVAVDPDGHRLRVCATDTSNID